MEYTGSIFFLELFPAVRYIFCGEPHHKRMSLPSGLEGFRVYKKVYSDNNVCKNRISTYCVVVKNRLHLLRINFIALWISVKYLIVKEQSLQV
jgi:hypothetical protein